MVATAAVAALALVPAGAAFAAPPSNVCDTRNNNTVEKLLSCVDADGALEHLEALQAIADENDGTRAAGLPGYEASVDYVVETLEAAGWNVTIDEFPFTFVGPSDARAAHAPERRPIRPARSPAPAPAT